MRGTQGIRVAPLQQWCNGERGTNGTNEKRAKMRNTPIKATLVSISVLVWAVGCNLATTDSPSIGGYNVYYGQLHSHTNISDGLGSPSEAYAYARDTAGLDFFSVADHDYWFDDMTQADWETLKNTANRYNDDGTYVTFWGFEWTSDIPDPDGKGSFYGHQFR
jgi:hypothetical protein